MVVKKKSRAIRKIYRDKDISTIESKISLLGPTAKFDAISYLNLKTLSIPVVFLLLLFTSDIGYLYAPFLTVFYYYFIDYLALDRPIKQRGLELEHQALSFFEVLTLTLESGRNLENSLEVTCANVKSELSKEFDLALMEMRFGKSLIEALSDLKYRIPSETINNIILNITQTSIFGSGILDTMYNQVEFLRDKQILTIKEQINKIPNKISIISVIFVVPLILMLILGPFLINFFG